MAVTCSKCGAPLASGATTCGACGSPVAARSISGLESKFKAKPAPGRRMLLYAGLGLAALIALVVVYLAFFRLDNYARVSNGMSRQEVHALLGKPTEPPEDQFPQTQMDKWTTADGHSIAVMYEWDPDKNQWKAASKSYR